LRFVAFHHVLNALSLLLSIKSIFTLLRLIYGFKFPFASPKEMYRCYSDAKAYSMPSECPSIREMALRYSSHAKFNTE
jgi:hypothetical protein